jgi:hypothetical protein
MQPKIKTPDEVKAVEASRFTQGTLLGIKYELLNINRKTLSEPDARAATNRQFRALEKAMQNRKKDPSALFSKFPPAQSAFLSATFRHLDRRYPKNFPSFPPGVTLEAKEYTKIKRDAARIVKSRTIIKSRTITNVRMPDGLYNFKFSYDLSKKDRAKLLGAIRKWKKDKKFSSLDSLFIKANVIPQQTEKILPDKTTKQVDSSLVFNHSMIKGEAKDFVYNKLGLGKKSIHALEQALSLRAKDENYDPRPFFKKVIKDKKQRENAQAAFNNISKAKQSKGKFLAGAAEASAIILAITKREEQLAAYKQPLSVKNWNIASITTSKGDLYYLRIPKSLMSAKQFKDLVESKKNPDEIALVFGLSDVADQMVARREGGSFVPSTEKERTALSKAKPKDLRYAWITGPKPKKKKRRA